MIVREYMQVGMSRTRLEMDPMQLHLKIVRQTATGEPEEELTDESVIVAVSELVWCGWYSAVGCYARTEVKSLEIERQAYLGTFFFLLLVLSSARSST